MDNEEEMMIWTEHLSKSYGEKEAVCDLTLEIRRGEIFGLLGPNGAGHDCVGDAAGRGCGRGI